MKYIDIENEEAPLVPRYGGDDPTDDRPVWQPNPFETALLGDSE
jgi:hypothetical protein